MGLEVKYGMSWVTDMSTGQMSYGYGPTFSWAEDSSKAARSAARERIVVSSSDDVAHSAASGGVKGLVVAGIAVASIAIGVGLLLSHRNDASHASSGSTPDFGGSGSGGSSSSGAPTGEDF